DRSLRRTWSRAGVSTRVLTTWRHTVLRIADLLHPINGLAVELFADGDVRHRVLRRRSVPVFLAGWNPNDVARTDLVNCISPALHTACSPCHDQSLPQRMRMPSGSCARLKSHARPGYPRWRSAREGSVDSSGASEVVGGGFP